MSDHTPTPWRFHWRKSEANKDEADCGIFSEQREGMVYAVARCPRYQSKERWEADASLICRAVNAHDDLVAALKYLLERERIDDDGESTLTKARDMAHGALAKAEGRS